MTWWPILQGICRELLDSITRSDPKIPKNPVDNLSMSHLKQSAPGLQYVGQTKPVECDSFNTLCGGDKTVVIFKTIFSSYFFVLPKSVYFVSNFIKMCSQWSRAPINNKPALLQIMAWCRAGDTLLSESMKAELLMQICVTRPRCKTKYHILYWTIAWLD